MVLLWMMAHSKPNAVTASRSRCDGSCHRYEPEILRHEQTRKDKSAQESKEPLAQDGGTPSTPPRERSFRRSTSCGCAPAFAGHPCRPTCSPEPWARQAVARRSGARLKDRPLGATEGGPKPENQRAEGRCADALGRWAAPTGGRAG